jgi:hypothetical protein
MFNPDPSSVIRALGRVARPGGIIAFHEADFSGRRSNPSAPMYDRCCDLIVETFKKVGTDPYRGRASMRLSCKRALLLRWVCGL